MITFKKISLTGLQLLLVMVGYTQIITNAKKWKYTACTTFNVPDSAMSEFQEYKNYVPKNNVLCLYFSAQSFEFDNNLYILFQYDSLFTNTGAYLDENQLAQTKACFKVDFKNHILINDKIYSLQNELNSLGDTIVKDQVYYKYAYKDLLFFAKNKISSVEDNFLTGNSPYIDIRRGNAKYEIKLIDPAMNIEPSKLLAAYTDQGKQISEEKMSILDFIVFKMN